MKTFPIALKAFPDTWKAFLFARKSFPGAWKAFPIAWKSFPDAWKAFPITWKSFPGAWKAFPLDRKAFPGACAVERFHDINVTIIRSCDIPVATSHPSNSLPQVAAFDFIDEFLAAHLIPFSESQNDHPTNGLALCKNHHWAMDRNLIAPCPDHHWHVSKILDPRRSNGEKELIALSGQSLLLPQDQVFHPDDMGLRYQMGKLIA